MAIIIARTLIIYLALLLTLRLMGKRQLGEMELSEFVTAALIADLASHPLQDMGIPLINGLLPIATLFCCELLLAGLSMKYIRLRELIFGRPSLIVVRGKILQQEMRKNRFTADELAQQLRAQGVLDIGSVEYAVLETSGKLNLILSPGERPPTVSQLGLKPEQEAYPLIVISDGRVLEANLRHLGLDRRWLEAELGRRGRKKPGEVFLMTVDRSGKIYFAEKEAG